MSSPAPLDEDRGRGLGDGGRSANFLATDVRHYLTAGGAKLAHPARGGPPSIETPPVELLGHARGLGPLQLPALARAAVDLPVITPRAEMDHPPTRVANTLTCRRSSTRARPSQPPGIRPPWARRATTLSSYASTRGDRGLGASPPGLLFVTIVPIVAKPTAGANYQAGGRPAPNQADPAARLQERRRARATLSSAGPLRAKGASPGAAAPAQTFVWLFPRLPCANSTAYPSGSKAVMARSQGSS
jgi:hypothetical protein